MLLASQLVGVRAAGAETPARAAEPSGRSARLQWQRLVGAEGCISGEELAATLQRRLRRGTIGGPEADVTLEGTIAPAESGVGYKAWLVVRDRSDQSLGTREVTSVETSCRALDEALLLVLTVIIDPSLAFEPGQGAASTSTPPARVASATSAETTWHLSAGGGASLGLVPGVGFGVLANAGVRPWGGPLLELGAAHWFASQVDSDEGSASVSVTYGTLNICAFPFASGAWQFGACAGGQGGVIRVNASDFGGENLSPSRPLANVTARAEARWQVSDPLFVRFSLGGAVPIVRDRFFFNTQTGDVVSLFRLSPVIGVLGLEGGITFH